MAEEKHMDDVQEPPTTRDDSNVSGDTKVEKTGDDSVRYNSKGVELFPQPSDDPHDPLNWPMTKKIIILAIMCYGTFVGISTSVANVLATPEQAKDWGVTPEEAAYSVSATLAGVLVGPIILCAAVRVFGIMSCCFWSEVAVTVVSVWSAVSTGPGKYGSFVASRAIAGLFTGTIQVFTTGVIAQIFFLHQRGKALAVYSTVYLVSSVAGPTFSGFIVQYVEWPVCFWWSVGANASVAILIFLFGDDTSWDRSNNKSLTGRDPPSSWVKQKVELFFPGTRVTTSGKMDSIKTSFSVLVRIFFSPICILAGIYGLINYTWFIMAGVQVPIILFEPPTQGGYGFTPLATGYFYFSAWVGAIIGVCYGILLNDRLPLWIKKKRGVWYPEYRLHVLWFPGLIVAPIGVGLFGAAVYYLLHYMVLAVALGLLVFGAAATVTPGVNYVIEVFASHPQEVGTALNIYRVALSIAVQFFYATWVMKVGANWVWGTAAFLLVFSSLIILLLVSKGAWLRKYSLLEDEAAAEAEALSRAQDDSSKASA